MKVYGSRSSQLHTSSSDLFSGFFLIPQVNLVCSYCLPVLDWIELFCS